MNKAGILYISCGVPGSGKTTFLNEFKNDNEVVISRDNIRFSLLKDGEDYFTHEREVYAKFVDAITKNIRNGINVYADATHLNYASRKKLTDALLKAGCQPVDVQAIYFDIPIDICLKRNEKRAGTKAYVPRGVIRRMFESLSYPIEFSHVWIVDEKGKVSKSK